MHMAMHRISIYSLNNQLALEGIILLLVILFESSAL